jgi:hypothetical protein
MFKNKHIIAALLISPILAILAYFAVDALVSEAPHSAVPGNSYELIAKSNCRYASGACTFKNGDMEITLTLDDLGNQVQLNLESAVPLDGVKIALVQGNNGQEPRELTPLNAERTRWQGTYDLSYTAEETLYLVTSAGEAFYYGETAAPFGHYETSFGKDFRHEE